MVPWRTCDLNFDKEVNVIGKHEFLCLQNNLKSYSRSPSGSRNILQDFLSLCSIGPWRSAPFKCIFGYFYFEGFFLQKGDSTDILLYMHFYEGLQ